MSLRRLMRLVLLLTLALLLGGIYLAMRSNKPSLSSGDSGTGTRAIDLQTADGIDPQAHALWDKAEVNRGSVLAPDGPAVEYTLPASAFMLRLSTNANVASLDKARRQREKDPTRRWTYALEIEELDAGGKLLHKRTMHFRRDLLEVELPGGGRGTGVFYLAGQAPKPLSTAVLRLDFSGGLQPAKVRVRLAEADPDITDVLLRVHTPEPISPRNARATWQRLSAQQRQRLAAGNVFPHELLLEQERNNIIASRWRPFGPSGPSGNVQPRDIYVLPSLELGTPADPMVPAAVFAGPQHKTSIQLPENGGRVRLALEPVNGDGSFPAQVQIDWYGISAFERSSKAHAWTGGRFETEEHLAGGWLEVGATRAGTVRAWILEGGQEREITPPVRYQRAFPAQDGMAVDYPITHVEGKPTPLRLVLRRMAAEGETFAPDPVKVAFIDNAGQVIRTNVLHPEWERSEYDVPWPQAPGSTVSEPVEVFFNVPADIRRMRVLSARPVMTIAYTRPGDLPRAVRTPEDSVSPESEKEAIPGWFALQPAEFESLILNGASRLMAVQARAPEDRPELAEGEFTFEDFQPLAGGAARVFFAPREPGVPDRPESVGVTYRPLPANGAVNILAEPGREQPAPKLAWVAEAKFGAGQVMRYDVRADGLHWAPGAAAGNVGETVLPPLKPGRHRLQVAADRKVNWFITHIGSGPAWVKRSAQRFDRAVRFEVERTTAEEEFISVRLFRPAGTSERMKVRVWVDAPKPADPLAPTEGWLFTERVHDVRPSGQQALPLAETAGNKTDVGQPFYIPFPQGSPKGRYRITLTPEGGTGWVAVSRIIPGRLAKPKLILEEARSER